MTDDGSLRYGQSVVWIDHRTHRPRQGVVRAVLADHDGHQDAAIVAPEDGGLVCVIREALRTGSLPK